MIDENNRDASTESEQARLTEGEKASERSYLDIPTTSRKRRHPIIFGHNSRIDFAGQRIKLLRTWIDTAASRRELKTLLITSTLPGEGKSTVAANLALSFGEGFDGGALAVDADLRNPRLHEAFRKPNGPGLVDYLLEERELKDLVLSTRDGRVGLLRAGTDNRWQSAELLSSARMRYFLSTAKQLFPDKVLIIDSAPLCNFADTRPLTEIVDGIILVVRAHSTPRDLILETLDAVDLHKMLGLVLNQATIRRRKAGREYYYRH